MYAKLLLLKPRTEEVLLQILSLIAEKEKEICSKEKDDDSKPIYLSSKKKKKQKKKTKTPIIKKIKIKQRNGRYLLKMCLSLIWQLAEALCERNGSMI